MRVRVVWWHLDGSATTVAPLCENLRDESVDAFGQVEGGFSDAPLSRRGAAYAGS